MVRETRGSAAAREAGTSQPPQSSPDASGKRKRRVSSDAAPSTSANADANGETPDSKRLRTSMNGKGSAETIDEESDTKPRAGRLLTKEIREAIAVVVSQMAAGLPSPINKVLTLWLPPDFTQNDENTLGWILKQDTLTWEKLVSTLHLFSEHLLLPCAYPNPVPSLARFHLPVPPLPSHFAPLTVYSFCRALHQLLLQVEAQIDGAAPVIPTGPQERWALMQKTPGNGLGTAGGEWFTAAANLREVEAARKKLKVKNGETLLATLAAGGDKFGNAQPLVIQATEPLGSEGKGNVPTLSDSVIRRASLKAQRWKDSLAARRRSGFGSVLHSASVPHVSAAPFTPTFGPLYDSLSATGLGYYSTLDLMHERRRRRLHKEVTAKIVEINDGDGWSGILDDKAETNGEENKPAAKIDSTDDVLSANAARVEELQAWQELRVIRGDVEWVSDREREVAEELFTSLAKLVESSDTPPSALLPANLESDLESGSIGLAHTLARRLLSNRAPIIRGILDPRRPQALHDNVTIRLRAQAAAAIVAPSAGLGINGTMASPHAQPPKVSPGTGFMPPPSSTIREPPPHTLPSNARYYSHGRAPYPVPSQQPQKSPHQPHQQLTPQQHHQALPSHQTLQHHQAMQSHHALQSHQQALQAHQAQQALQSHQAMQSHQQAMQQQQQQQQQLQNMQMAQAGSPAHAHMRAQAAMMGMPGMAQAYAQGSPVQQVFRPPTSGGAHVMHPQHMGSPYSRTPMTQAAAVAAGLGGSPSPNQMAYPQQRMMVMPSGLRQAYAMPGTPGTPGTPGMQMQMPMYAQASYGSPMPVRMAGMPGVPMMGAQQLPGQIPGQQVQMHR